MRTNFEKVKLSEIMEIIGGGTPKTTCPEYWNGHIPWLSVVDFNSDNRYVEKTEKTITEAGLENSSTKILEKGDLIISARGTVGALAQLKKPMAFNQSCYGLRAGKETNNDFLYYLLKYNLQNIQNITHGSVFSTITRETFDYIDVLLPPLDEQKRIAGVLGAFDEKIELLQKQNKTLEDMAKAIFKSWFVDFDIVKAKQRGEDKQKILSTYKITEELYNLFPSSFTDAPASSIGPIPTGWEVKNVEDILALSIGGGWGKDVQDEEFSTPAFVIRGTDIPSIKSGNFKEVPFRYHKESNYKSRILKDTDVIIEVAGGSKGQPVGRALLVTGGLLSKVQPAICASFCRLIRINKNVLLPEIFYFFLDRMYSTGEIEQYQVQSTGISNFQFSQFLKDKYFTIPPVELQKSFGEIINKVLEKIDNNKKQIQTLTELRDGLLPRLLSGKLQV